MSAVKLPDIYPAGFNKLIPGGDYEFRELKMTGTVDIKLKYVTIEFQYVANEPDANGRRYYYLGGGTYNDLKEIGPGDFSVIISVRKVNIDISKLPPGEIQVQIMNVLSAKGQSNPEWDYDSGEKIPSNIHNDAIMATIHNLRIEPVIQ